MARVTVEDCLRNVKNRFELVMIAAKRARQLMRGKEPKVDWDNDKATVVALREIAEGYTNFDKVDVEEEHPIHHHLPPATTPSTPIIDADDDLDDDADDHTHEAQPLTPPTPESDEHTAPKDEE